MRVTRTDDVALVVAAQAGDRRAAEDLLRAHLPLIYTIVRRGMGEHPDADDVVQETVLRIVRQLPGLRFPERFRSWAAAIAVRQVGTHLRRADAGAARSTGLDEVLQLPDPRAPSQEATVLALDLSGQRRQAERAGRWLDPEHRALLPLWWLEVAGIITRAELAEAAHTSVAHAGVRLQRMRAQLETSRALVAALESRRPCPGLRAVTEHWDGRPGPLWRKRIDRHVRDCPICSGAAAGLTPADRLLPALPLLVVPPDVVSSALGATSAVPAAPSAGAGLAVVQAVAAHPVAASLAAGVLVFGGVAAATSARPAPPPAVAAPPPAVAAPARVPASSPASAPASSPASSPAAAPASGPGSSSASGPGSPAVAAPGSVPPGALGAGPVSLEAQNVAGRFLAFDGDTGVLQPASAASDPATRARVTLQAVPGLNDPACFSFRVGDRHLRHSSWRIRLHPDDGSVLFRGDATFCPRPGVGLGSIVLESSNYPGWFLRHRGDQLWVDQTNGSAAFLSDSSFVVRPALAD